MKKLEDYQLNLSNFEETATEDMGGDSMQKMLGVTEDVLKKYYDVAVHLLENKKWEDACDAFIFLTFLNSERYSFWLGLGIAEQSLQNFEKAVTAYNIASAIEPQNPVPLANMYQCLSALGKANEAEEVFNKAVQLCGKTSEHEGLKKRLVNYHR